MVHEVIKVEGMTCGHCKATVETTLTKLEGVSSATVDLAKKEVAVDFEETKITMAKIKEEIDEIGYTVLS